MIVQDHEHIRLHRLVVGQFNVEGSHIDESQTSKFYVGAQVGENLSNDLLMPSTRGRCHIQNPIYNLIAFPVIWKGRVVFISPAALPWSLDVVSSTDHGQCIWSYCHICFAFLITIGDALSFI